MRAVAVALDGEEKEGAVASVIPRCDHGATGTAAELVVNAGRAGTLKEIPCVQTAARILLESAAVRIVSPGLRGHRDGGDGPIFRAVIDHRQLHLLNGFEARLHWGNLAATLVAKGNSVHQKAVLETAGAAEGMGGSALIPERAGGQAHVLEDAAAERVAPDEVQRQLLHLAAGPDIADGACLALNHGSLRGHRDRIGDLPYLHREIDP